MGFSSSSSHSADRRRHGFVLECKTCQGARTNVGGIESPKQFSKILQEYKHRHRDHDYDLKQSYHAVELAHASQLTNQVEQTSTSATYGDFTNNSIAAASFTAGKKYLISVTGVIRGSATTARAQIKMVHGTTDFGDSIFGLTPAAANGRYTYSWFTVFTQPAGGAEIIKAQISTQTATSTTVGIDQFTIVAIKLSDDLVENTDWIYAEDNVSASLPAAGVNGATTGAFTPAAANHEWLVMGRSRVTATIATRSIGTRIVRSGEASSTTPFLQFEPQAATDFPVFSTARVFTLGAASNTFTEQSFTSAGTNHTRTNSGIFVLDLSKLAAVADSYDDATVQDLSATGFASTVRSVSISPTVQGDVWTYGMFTHDQNAITITHKGRIQIDNTTDVPANATTDNYTLWVNKDTTDESPYVTQGMDNLTAASHTIDLDGSTSAAVAGRGARAKSLFAVTMEISAGLALIKQVTESEDITEALSRGLGKSVTTESEDVTEALSRLSNLARKADESEPITEGLKHLKPWYEEFEYDLRHYESLTTPDKKNAVGGAYGGGPNLLTTPGFEKLVGTEPEDWFRYFFDTGMASVEIAPANVRSGQYSIHLKNASPITPYTYSGIDSANLIVTPNQQYRVEFYAKGTVGSDNTTSELAIFWYTSALAYISKSTVTIPTNANYSDWTLLSNTVTAPATAERAVVSLFIDRTCDIYFDDVFASAYAAPLSFQETTLNVYELVKKLQEDYDTNDYDYADYDTLAGGVDYKKVADESVGLTEATARISDKIRELTESNDIAENISRLVNRIRLTNESLDISEATSKQFAKQLTESLGITEAISRGFGKQVSESLGITESLSKAFAKQLTESVQISEEVNRRIELTRAISESVDISEASVFLRELVRAVDESLDVSEVIARIKGVIRETTDPTDIAESVISLLGIVKEVTPAEAVDITESVVKILALPPQLIKEANEDVAITEAINYIVSKIRVVDEAIDVSEAVSYIRQLIRIVDETTDLTEVVSRVSNLTRQFSESIDIAEALTQVRGIVKVVGGVMLGGAGGDFVPADFVDSDFVAGSAPYMEEVVGITEALSKIIAQPPPNVQQKQEAVDIMEAINYLVNKFRVVDESIDISENISRLTDRIRAVNEDVPIGEAYSIARNLIRIQDEQVGVTESIGRLSNLIRVLDESVGILDDLRRNLSLTRVADETIGLIESLSQAMTKIRVLDETLDISDLAVAIVSPVANQVIKEVTDNLDISEALSKIHGFSKQVSESVDISDANTAYIRGLSKAVNESVDLTESLSRIGAFIREVNEQVWITELTDRIRTLAREIAETVDISEAAQPIKGLSRIVDEVVDLSETQISAPGKALVVSEVVAITEELVTSLQEVEEFPPMGAPSGFHLPYRIYKKTRKKAPPLERPKTVEPKPTIELPLKVVRFKYNIESEIARTKVSKRVRFRYSIKTKSRVTIQSLVANAIVDRLASNTIIQRARATRKLEQPFIENEKNFRQQEPVYNFPKGPPIRLQDGTIILKPHTVKKTLTFGYQKQASVSKALRATYRKYVLTSKLISARYNLKSAKDYRQLKEIKQLLQIKEALDLLSDL